MPNTLIDAQHNTWASMDPEGKYGAEGCARQTYRRRPVEVGRVMLAWELSMGCQK
jgi:hypothetical protein